MFCIDFFNFFLFKCIDVVCDVWDMELIVRVGESYNRVYGVWYLFIVLLVFLIYDWLVYIIVIIDFVFYFIFLNVGD